MSDPFLSVTSVIFALQDEAVTVLLDNQLSLPQTPILPGDLHLEAAAQRCCYDLMDVNIPYWEQVQTIGDPIRDPRGWSVSVVYYGLISYPKDQKQIPNYQWINIEKVWNAKLAFDHHHVIELCYKRLQNKSLYTSLPIFLLPSEFTLTELQKTYESVLGFKIEKKSFRRRLLDAGFLEETSNVRRASHRPAQLYRLSNAQPYFFARIIEGARAHCHPEAQLSS